MTALIVALALALLVMAYGLRKLVSERNAIAAVRAVDCAAYALLSDGAHIVSFDEVVQAR